MTVEEYIEQDNIDKDITELDISIEGITSLTNIALLLTNPINATKLNYL